MANGLQRLLVLSLQNTPPADTIKLTAAVWCDTVWPHTNWEDGDVNRIEMAFQSLCRNAERWPTPKHFIDCLPRRAELLKLPERMSPEDRELGKKRMAEIVSLVRKVAR